MQEMYYRLVFYDSILSDSSTNTAIKEFEQEEYYINTHFDSVLDSVKLFADDELRSKPGMPVISSPLKSML